MLTLGFEGWFQCRLATNPDPSDEPRGVSGSTFAVAGEPDLDGVIRLHDAVAPRLHAPPIGVSVVSVSVDGVSRPEHALLGARVDLVGQPRFEERNGIIAKPGEAPVHPFTIDLTKDDVRLRRDDLFDQRRPDLAIHEVEPELLRRRQPVHTGQGSFALADPEVADATGIADFGGHLLLRRRHLEDDLAHTSDPILRAALERRIEALQQADWRVQFRLGFRVDYAFELNGRAEVTDPAERLRGDVLTSPYWLPRWPIRFWMGGFDSDGLCAYLRGTLEVPFRPY